MYQSIRDALRTEIRTGLYGAGERLPSETTLVRRFGVSRVTIRQAIEALRKTGLVVSVQGKGSFVSMPRAVHDTPALLGFHEAMLGRGFEPSSRLLSAREQRADREVAQALRLPRGAGVLEIRRLRCLDARPVSLDVSYFPADIGARLMSGDLGGDLFPLLEQRCAVALAHAEVSIEALPCDAADASLLGLTTGAPVLFVRRLTRDRHGRPVDYEHLVCRGDASQYRVQLVRRKPW